ncbi:MAG: non-ribosomal peptide synthetase [Pseudomonadales bacterium]
MTTDIPQPSTLVQALDVAAAGMRGIRFISAENDERYLKYSELKTRALVVLHFLQQHGVSAGKQLILFVSDNMQFIDAFWAAQLGGVVPVPLAVGNSDEHRRKVFNVFANLQDAHVLTSRKNLQRLEAFANSNGMSRKFAAIAAKSLLVDKISEISKVGRTHENTAQDTAFIQFSSGSTGSPKGVVLTHRNLLHNINSITHSAEMDSSDSFFSWMPLTHDMGIIGFHLTPLVLGVEQNIMPSDLFVRRPQLWLLKASQHKATILSSPNFGYKHYLKSVERKGLPEMDLSSVRLLFNGAEPISLSLCEQFSSTLAARGLAHNAMYPVYGLAEASLAVTFPEPGAVVGSVGVERASLQLEQAVRLVEEGAADAPRFVNLGRPISDTFVCIGDERGQELAEGFLGRVLIRGENVTAGYYGNAELNAASYTADGWLDTGDLGFMREGCLFITGRSKELIILNGQNYYPHDIELLCEQVEGVELGKVAVVAIEGDAVHAEGAQIFVTYKGALEDFLPLAQQLRRVVLEKAGMEVENVIPLRTIPKTTSGKFQRVALAEAYRNGEYSEAIEKLSGLAPPTGAEHSGDGAYVQRLRQIVQSVISDVDISVDDNILDVGTSSLKLAQIHEQIDEEFPDQIDLTDLFDHPTVNLLAAFLQAKLD